MIDQDFSFPNYIYLLLLYCLLSHFLRTAQHRFLREFHTRVNISTWDHDWHEYSSSLCRLSLTMQKHGTSKNIKVFILLRFTEFEKMLPFTKTYLFSFTDRDKATNRLKCEYVWKCEVVVPWIYARVCGGTAWADSLNFSGYVLFFASHFPNVSISLVSRSQCKKFLKTMITEDAILNFISTRVSGTGFSAS